MLLRKFFLFYEKDGFGDDFVSNISFLPWDTGCMGARLQEYVFLDDIRWQADIQGTVGANDYTWKTLPWSVKLFGL